MCLKSPPNCTSRLSQLRQAFTSHPGTAKFKLFYLLFFSALAAMPIYLSVYLRHAGLSATSTGIIIAVQPLTRAFVCPAIGALADKTRRHKLVLILCISLGAASFTCLSYIWILQELDSIMIYPNNTQFNNTLDLNINSSKLSSTRNITATTQGTTGKQFLSTSTIFLSSLVLATIEQCFMAPAEVIMSATLVKEMGSKVFGRQRLYGAVGFGLTSYLSGVAMDATSGIGYFSSASPQGPNYMTAFFIYVIVIVALLILVGVGFNFRNEKRATPIVFIAHLKVLLSDYSLVLLMVVILIIGINGGIVTYFLFWYLQDLGAPQSLLGLSIAIMCSSEIIIFPFTGQLITKLGHIGVFALTLICFILRFIVYSVLHNPWLVLIVEPLHGITFAAFWTTCVSLASVIAPREIQTTAQGLVAGVHFGLGWGSGALLGGIVYGEYGPRNMFRGGAVLSGVGLITLAIAHKTWKRRAEDHKQSVSVPECEAFELE